MNDSKGFTVDTEAADEILVASKKRPTAKKKKPVNKMGIIMIAICAAVLAAVIFCAAVPCIGYQVMDTRTCLQNDDTRKEIAHYGKNGEITETEYFENDEKYGIEKNTYEKGRIVKTETLCFDRLYRTTVYEYSKEGLLKKTDYDADNTATTIYDYTYENNQLISETQTDDNGKLLREHTYTYDENGRKATDVMYDPEFDYTSTTEFVYDGTRLTEAHERAGSYHDMTTVYTYDENGRLIKEKYESYEIDYTYSFRTEKMTVFQKLF